tara:strand:- start:346 stop:1062 length:717 start_codon:yes stop_codon:yes gene_type:complete
MSKVSFGPIQPGDVASITAPNATMAATASATAAVNAENVRPEGIDERNLVFPLVSTISYDSGDWIREIPGGYLNMFKTVDAGSNWTGGTGTSPTFGTGLPFSITLGTDFNYAIIRYSFEIQIEGRVAGCANYVSDDLGFAIFRDNTLLATTERHIQNSVAKSASRLSIPSEAARSAQSVTLITHHTLNGNFNFDLRFKIDTRGSPGLSPDSKINIPWTLFTTSPITISRLTASVIKYK